MNFTNEPAYSGDGADLDRARRGDVDVLTALLEEVGPQVRNELDIAPKWQSALDLDDVMQVTYLEAYLRIGQFAGDTREVLKAWMRQIARNNINAAIRGLSRKKRPPPEKRIVPASDNQSYVDLCGLIGITTTTPSRAASRREAKVLIENALERLPEDYATAIRLFDLEGRAGPEAAQHLQRSRGAAFMLLARARDRLRELLGSERQFFSDPA